MAKTYNIFISHSWSYSDAYDKLKEFLSNRPYFSYADYSIPKDDPVHVGSDAELYAAILNKMQLCHAVLIMAGVYSTYSKWINKEIQAAKQGYSSAKPIIGIKPWAQTNVSSVVAANADVLVGWNTESIVGAITEYAL